jgi:hypothetical protein
MALEAQIKTLALRPLGGAFRPTEPDGRRSDVAGLLLLRLARVSCGIDSTPKDGGDCPSPGYGHPLGIDRLPLVLPVSHFPLRLSAP